MKNREKDKPGSKRSPMKEFEANDRGDTRVFALGEPIEDHLKFHESKKNISSRG